VPIRLFRRLSAELGVMPMSEASSPNLTQPPLRGARFLLAYLQNMAYFSFSLIAALLWPKRK
jgi:hypothetical protein